MSEPSTTPRRRDNDDDGKFKIFKVHKKLKNYFLQKEENQLILQ